MAEGITASQFQWSSGNNSHQNLKDIHPHICSLTPDSHSIYPGPEKLRIPGMLYHRNPHCQEKGKGKQKKNQEGSHRKGLLGLWRKVSPLFSIHRQRG